MIRSRIIGALAAGALAVGTLAVATPAGADLDGVMPDNQIMQCSGFHIIASLNPAIEEGDGQYMKAGLKASDGTKAEFLSDAPIAPNAVLCAVDAGIRTNNPALDTNKPGKYRLDDQISNAEVGNTSLSMGVSGPFSAGAKVAGSLQGAGSCYLEDPAPAAKSYPNAYPLNGKVIWKYDQADYKGKQQQTQQYIRVAAIPATLSDLEVTGIVIKGAGLGGTAYAAITFYPTNNAKKNVNPLGCADGLTPASLAELHVYAIDGPDANLTVDPWSISLPS